MSQIFYVLGKTFLDTRVDHRITKSLKCLPLMTLTKLQHQLQSLSWHFFSSRVPTQTMNSRKADKTFWNLNFSRNARYFNCRTWGRILFTFWINSLHFLWFLISFSWIRKLLCTVDNKIDVSRFKYLDQFICKFSSNISSKLFTFSSKTNLLVLFPFCQNSSDFNFFATIKTEIKVIETFYVLRGANAQASQLN